jgi:hypothetical protein
MIDSIPEPPFQEKGAAQVRTLTSPAYVAGVSFLPPEPPAQDLG